jgi:hypothetical protein
MALCPVESGNYFDEQFKMALREVSLNRRGARQRAKQVSGEPQNKNVN